MTRYFQISVGNKAFLKSTVNSGKISLRREPPVVRPPAAPPEVFITVHHHKQATDEHQQADAGVRRGVARRICFGVNAGTSGVDFRLIALNLILFGEFRLDLWRCSGGSGCSCHGGGSGGCRGDDGCLFQRSLVEVPLQGPEILQQGRSGEIKAVV